MTHDATEAKASLNARAGVILRTMIADAAVLNLRVGTGPRGETLVDCGHAVRGGIEAGLRLARIATAGLADIALVPSPTGRTPWSVLVRTGQPVLACLASQYAGWHLKTAGGADLMGSGPARALAGREPLFEDIPHQEAADRAILVIEGDEGPGPDVTSAVAEACKLRPDRLTLLHAPTGSLAGMVQIAARVVECAVQKARVLEFPLGDLVEAVGAAPIQAPHPATRVAMGRANDAIIHGGQVQLFVGGPADRARTLADQLPSSTSPDWGRSFAEVYEAAEGDFGKIDSGLFSPALVSVTALETGETFTAGRMDPGWPAKG